MYLAIFFLLSSSLLNSSEMKSLCIMKCEIWEHFESLYECKNKHLEMLSLGANKTKLLHFFLILEHRLQKHQLC